MAKSEEDKTPSIDFLEMSIRMTETQEAFDRVRWKSLKVKLASTTAMDLASVAAKLRVVSDGIAMDVDQLDLDVLRSAIDDLYLLSGDRRLPGIGAPRGPKNSK